MDHRIGVARLGGIGGSQWVFAPGVSVATLSMLKSASKVGSTCTMRVKVTWPPGATVTWAVMAPEPDVGVTEDPAVAVAVQEPAVTPAGMASVTVP